MWLFTGNEKKWYQAYWFILIYTGLLITLFYWLTWHFNR